MDDVGGVECRKRLTARRPAPSHPHDQGDHHEHQSHQCRRSGADEDVKALPGGKWRQHNLLHDRSSLRCPCKCETAHTPPRLSRRRHDWTKSNTRRWDGSLCVSEEDMSSFFILSHLSAASVSCLLVRRAGVALLSALV